VLDLDFSGEPPDLIEGLVPRGVLFTIAGLPETFKGWTAAKIADVVARGSGEVLGCAACAQGPVGYFWQDDSTRNEAERVQLYARVHETPRDLPIRWYLNEGVSLPADIDRLKATISEHGFVLIVLDSVYNFTSDLDLKDRDVGALFARLKAEICDELGCTIVLIDHMPWATDTNRKRLRAYGDMFKGAAVRAGLYIDAEGAKLWVEARGNNIRGFKRTPAYWDADALELRLVDTTAPDEADEVLDARVLGWLMEHSGSHSTTAVRKGAKGRLTKVDEALERLKTRDEVRDHGRNGGTWSGRGGDARYWIASVHAASTPSELFGTRLDAVGSGVSERETSSAPSHPRRGDEVDRDEVLDAVSGDEEGGDDIPF